MTIAEAQELEIKRPVAPKAPRLVTDSLRTLSRTPDAEDNEVIFKSAQIRKLDLEVREVTVVEFRGCELNNSVLSGPLTLDLADCVVNQCRFVTPVRFERVARVRFVGCKFSAADFGTAGLVDVQFERCTFMAPSFWRSALRRVSFTATRLEAADLTEARLTDVSFEDSILLKPTLHQVSVERVDLSGSAELVVGRAADLKGWIIGEDQVRDMAIAMALELGLVVVSPQPKQSGRPSGASAPRAV